MEKSEIVMSVQGAPAAQLTLTGPRCAPFAAVPLQPYRNVSNASDVEADAYLGSDVGQLDTRACECRHGTPLLVVVKAVCIGMADKVFQEDVLCVTTSTIGLDHHHLIRVYCVHIPVYHIRDCCIDA